MLRRNNKEQDDKIHKYGNNSITAKGRGRRNKPQTLLGGKARFFHLNPEIQEAGHHMNQCTEGILQPEPNN